MASRALWPPVWKLAISILGPLAPEEKGSYAVLYDPSSRIYDSSQLCLSLANGNRMVEEFQSSTGRMRKGGER